MILNSYSKNNPPAFATLSPHPSLKASPFAKASEDTSEDTPRLQSAGKATAQPNPISITFQKIDILPNYCESVTFMLQ
jgi:hypothetical protein